MKNLRFLLLAALAMPALAADPSTVKQYQTLQQAYYQFDPDAYKSFSCHVDVSSLDVSQATIKQTMALRPGALQMTDTLANYTLTVDHASGISITDPTLDIQFLNEKAAADPERVKLGINRTKDGFTRQVQGADAVLTGLFEGFLDKVPDLTSVTRDGKRWVVKYVESGMDTTDTYDGSRIHEVATAPGVSMVSDSDFMPLGGKLVPQDTDGKISQGPQSVTTHMAVTYQKLGALQIPAVITSKTTLDTPSLIQTTVSITITLQSCSIKN